MGGPRRHLHLLLTVACVVTMGCVHRDDAAPHRPPDAAPLERFTILTYNVLHGLRVRGRFVRPGETKAAGAARLDLQIEQVAEVEPDVVLLQEVNPLPQKANAIIDGLRRRGHEYHAVHQVDACGLRLFGLRLVPGLNNGLVVLAKAPLRLRKVAGVKLSGLGGCGDIMGLQLNELRYALIAEIDNPGTGNSFLVVSVHLHSGIERAAYFLHKLAQAEEEGTVRREDVHDIIEALEASQSRRLEEIHVLVTELSRLLEEGTYLGAIVGGDFNFEPNSPEYLALRRAGLRDTYLMASPTAPLHSYDPVQNAVARREEVVVPRALQRAMRRLPPDDRRKVISGYRRGVARARRIDYLFHMRSPHYTFEGCLQQALFGEAGDTGLAGSDHYGVLNTYVLDASRC